MHRSLPKVLNHKPIAHVYIEEIDLFLKKFFKKKKTHSNASYLYVYLYLFRTDYLFTPSNTWTSIPGVHTVCVFMWECFYILARTKCPHKDRNVWWFWPCVNTSFLLLRLRLGLDLGPSVAIIRCMTNHVSGGPHNDGNINSHARPFIYFLHGNGSLLWALYV